MNMDRDQRIWAFVLIGLGALLLLGNLFGALWQLWPLLLIAIGLYLIFGRPADTTKKQGRFTDPIGNATAARVKLHLSVGEDRIRALTDSENLIDADIAYVGEIDFVATGDTDRYIELRQTGGSNWVWFNPFTWFSSGIYGELRWDVGLSPNVPLDLEIHNGVGEAELDLEQLDVTELSVRGGLGEMELTMPAKGESYPARVQGGAGECDIRIPSGAALEMKIKGGLGNFDIATADDAAARVEVSGGIGEVKIPSSKFEHVQDREGEFELRKSGVWETANFANAERQVIIIFDGGVGNLRLR